MEIHKGKKIHSLIKASGYSVDQVADKLDRRRGYMYNLFQKAEISPDVIKRLGEILIVDMTQIFPDFNPSIVVSDPEIKYSKLPRPQNAYDIQEMNTLRDIILDLTREMSNWKEKYYQLRIENLELKHQLKER